MSCSILRPMRELTCLHRGYRGTSLGGHMPSLNSGPQSESPVPAKCWRVALWRVIQRPPQGLECAWLRLQQAWVCLSCFSEVEANVLNGFECLRKFSFLFFCFSAEQLFRHGLKISLGELKAETSLTLNVIWLKKKSLILEQMKNGLLTSDKGQHQKAWAHWGHGSGRGANPGQAGC